MEQESVNLPTWAKVVRVSGVIAGALAFASVAYIVSIHVFDSIGLKYLWNQMTVTEWLRDIYFLLLLIPIRFIKKRKFVELVYYAFAALAIFRYGEVMWDLFHKQEVVKSIVIAVFILSVIFIGIIISNAILVLRWSTFKTEKELPAAAESK